MEQLIIILWELRVYNSNCHTEMVLNGNKIYTHVSHMTVSSDQDRNGSATYIQDNLLHAEINTYVTI